MSLTHIIDIDLLSKMENLKEAVAKIREVRNNRGIKMSEPLEVFILENDNATNLYQLEGAKELVIKLGNLSSLEFSKTEIDNSVGFLAKTEQYFVKLNQTINSAEEKEKLEKELTYYIGFVKSINAKLSNEKFVNGAPAAVIENERKKLADGARAAKDKKLFEQKILEVIAGKQENSLWDKSIEELQAMVQC